MELGEKLRMIRVEAGLSQRQLCEGIVTRNMLSQIENGSAKPSMKTLGLLAERLGKTISFFLEETAVLSPNQQVMEKARANFDAADYEGAIDALVQYQEPDTVYDREFSVLWNLSHMGLAGQQLEQGKERYAQELLEKADRQSSYLQSAMERQRLLLLGKASGGAISHKLPSLDEELLLRAKEAKNPDRVEALLNAVENQESAEWQYLRGKTCFQTKQYEKAVSYLHRAEEKYSADAAAMLEICYRELGDFKQAYYYACKQK